VEQAGETGRDRGYCTGRGNDQAKKERARERAGERGLERSGAGERAGEGVGADARGRTRLLRSPPVLAAATPYLTPPPFIYCPPSCAFLGVLACPAPHFLAPPCQSFHPGAAGGSGRWQWAATCGSAASPAQAPCPPSLSGWVLSPSLPATSCTGMERVVVVGDSAAIRCRGYAPAASPSASERRRHHVSYVIPNTLLGPTWGLCGFVGLCGV
jgi:hypothetical protein